MEEKNGSVFICSKYSELLKFQSGSFTVGISALVRVTLQDGCFHEVFFSFVIECSLKFLCQDIGYGVADNIRGQGAALEKAKKEAITDVCRLFLYLLV